MSHRRVPLPFDDAIRGICRWCGNWISDENGVINKRRRWHEQCVKEYTDKKYPHNIIRKKFDHKCALCGIDERDVHCPSADKWCISAMDVDHIIPLIDGGSHELDNLQLLCRPCHRKKTAKEAKLRRGGTP